MAFPYVDLKHCKYFIQLYTCMHVSSCIGIKLKDCILKSSNNMYVNTVNVFHEFLRHHEFALTDCIIYM